MKHTRYGPARPALAGLGLLLVLACARSTTSGRSVSPSREVTSLTQATTAFLGAFDSLNWPRFSSFLSDTVDAYWPRPDSAEHLRNRAAVEARYRAFFERVRSTRPGPPFLHLAVSDLTVRVIPPIGIVTFELADVPDTVGRRTLIFRHENAGWRIVHLHASNLARLP